MSIEKLQEKERKEVEDMTTKLEIEKFFLREQL